MFEVSNAVAAFSEDQVERLTRLSKGRLRYWDRTGFLSPALNSGQNVRFGRVYSFREVVALRTLGILRVQNNVPLQHLRKVAEKLGVLNPDLWATTTLWVLNREVIFGEPGTGKPRAVLSGQYVIPVELNRIVTDTQRDIETMRRRSEDEIGHVGHVRGISRSAAVLSGTRIRVDSVRRLHEDGYTAEQIIAEYPDLTESDVTAALRHDKAAA